MVYFEEVGNGLVAHAGARDLNYPSIADVRAGINYGYDSAYTGVLLITDEVSDPAVAALSVVDNGDGLGGTFTVNGSDNGAVNSVYTRPVGSGVFVLTSQISGDGSIDFALPEGSYWGYVESVGSGGKSLSAPLVFSITAQGAVSGLRQIRTALRSALLSESSLAGLLGSGEAVYYSAPPRSAVKPYIVITDEPQNKTRGLVTFCFNLEIITLRSEALVDITDKLLIALESLALFVGDYSICAVKVVEGVKVDTGKLSAIIRLEVNAYKISNNVVMAYQDESLTLPSPEAEQDYTVARNQVGGESLSGAAYTYDRGAASPVMTLEFKALTESEKSGLISFFNDSAKARLNEFSYTGSNATAVIVKFAQAELSFTPFDREVGLSSVIIQLLVQQ